MAATGNFHNEVAGGIRKAFGYQYCDTSGPPLTPPVTHSNVTTGDVLTAEMFNAVIADIGKLKEASIIQNPLKKCGHCGQWGAVYCECVKCGAPIDP